MAGTKHEHFYGLQSEQFTFYKVPKQLFVDEEFWNVSAEAKLLYGILLDRMRLSAINNWRDEDGKIYIIFTIDEIKASLGCADKKAVKLLNELETKCGLIDRVRQGLGKPNIIYVRNFLPSGVDNLVERQVLNCQKDNSGDVKNTIQEVVDDEAMLRTVESVAQYGVLVPAIARPREDGGYELVSGHRRHHASELAGLQTMPAYERWATNFNLKSMSKTLLFLRDHQVESIEELKAKEDEATSKFNQLSSDIKSKEAKIAELTALKKHIFNYVDTRDVYIQYRKSGYNKQFFEQHREAITLHKAAKQAFNESGFEKIPKIKELNSQIYKLMNEKKELYADYRKLKNDMQELMKARKNVERFLADEMKNDGKEKGAERKNDRVH